MGWILINFDKLYSTANIFTNCFSQRDITKIVRWFWALEADGMMNGF